MWIKKHIPNILTLGNLACGFVVIIVLGTENISQPYGLTAILMGLALAFDFFDGLAARLLKVITPIGKDLDSLADVVSFGVVPGLMVFKILQDHFWYDGYGFNPDSISHYLPFVSIFIPLFSALRLAKFNHDTRQSEGFRGLPTPANTLFFLSLYMIYYSSFFQCQGNPDFTFQNWQCVLISPWVIIGLAVLFSFLLISVFRLLAFKFKSWGWKENAARYILILLSVVLLFFLKVAAIPIIILAYFVISFIHYRWVEKAES